MGVKICYTKDTEREVDSNVPLITLKFLQGKNKNKWQRRLLDVKSWNDVGVSHNLQI